ncbi:MAG: glycosyltransferase [Candidatus Micrarchaeota archaeon]|nr:glycosyltransferase [Candidatus Micrarchaeota archaeon]
MKKVSVIIAAYNSEKSIGKVLDALDKQDYGNFEVIVVDDCSKDGTSEVVKKFKKFKLIRNKRNRGLSGSVNVGIRESKGSIIMTLHDDSVPMSDTWMSDMVATFEMSPEIGIVSSDYVINFKGLNLTDKCFSFAYHLGEDMDLAKKDGVEDIETISDKCDAYRRDVLEQVGLFDETFRNAGEDMDISKKVKALGYRIIRNNRCKVEHRFTESKRERTVWDHFRKAFQITECSIYVLLRYGMMYKVDTLLFVLSSIICWAVPVLTLPFYIISILLNRAFSIFGILAFAAFHYLRPELIGQPSLALTIGLSYLLVKNFLKALRYLRKYRKFDLILPIWSFCLAWDIASGLGWTVGILNFLKVKVTSRFMR